MKAFKTFTKVDNWLICSFGGALPNWAEVKTFIKEECKGIFMYQEKTWKVQGSYEDKLRAKGFVEEGEEAGDAPWYTLPTFIDHNKIELDDHIVPETMRSYQKECVQFLMSRRGRALVGLPMGSGKGAISAIYMAHHHEVKPWLFVVPASLKVTLAKEIMKWTRMKAVVIFSSFKASQIRQHHEVLVCNYDILHKLVPELAGNVCGIVCDEAHYLSNMTSKRTQALIAIAKTVNKTVFMSGTPLRNRPVELLPMLQMIDNNTWKDTATYHKRYCQPRIGYGGAVVYDGATNLPELHNRIKPYMYYKSLEEILPELPPMQEIAYKVEVVDKEFRKENDEIQALIESGHYDKAELLERMAELARSAFFHKRSAFYEMVDDYLAESGEKVVLVGVHKTVIADMVDKYKCEFISGMVPSHNRNAIVERFHSDPDKRVLVLQLESANAGFSILCSRTMFFGELNYSYTALTQMKARVRRMNTIADKCLYYSFTVEDSIEERMFDLMGKKENIASQVIAGKESTSLLDTKYEVLLSGDE